MKLNEKVKEGGEEKVGKSENKCVGYEEGGEVIKCEVGDEVRKVRMYRKVKKLRKNQKVRKI